jgi:hypothetical protein
MPEPVSDKSMLIPFRLRERVMSGRERPTMLGKARESGLPTIEALRYE